MSREQKVALVVTALGSWINDPVFGLDIVRDAMEMVPKAEPETPAKPDPFARAFENNQDHILGAKDYLP